MRKVVLFPGPGVTDENARGRAQYYMSYGLTLEPGVNDLSHASDETVRSLLDSGQVVPAPVEAAEAAPAAEPAAESPRGRGRKE